MKSAIRNCCVCSWFLLTHEDGAHRGQSKLMETEHVLCILLQRGIYIYMYVVFEGVREDITADAAAGATTAWRATLFNDFAHLGSTGPQGPQLPIRVAEVRFGPVQP